jgi:hypothetical protein
MDIAGKRSGKRPGMPPWADDAALAPSGVLVTGAFPPVLVLRALKKAFAAASSGPVAVENFPNCQAPLVGG